MTSHDGLKAAREYPLWDAIFGRRSRRVAAGVSFRSGTLSFHSKLEPQPLTRLEEALLIAATGITGIAFADNPYETTDGQPLLGTPLIEARGRAAGSPDNAQSTHFFMWNDEGTYLLKAPSQPPSAADVRTMSADELIAHAERCKVKIKDGRLDFPRSFPAYASGNRYVSNVPGSTMFVPVTEVTRQYINGLFYVLAQEPGQRPMFVDDFNLFLPCGCEKWVVSKFLNKDIPIPLGIYAKGRTEYESLLLLQNLALVAQGMGLGGWIHAAFAPTILLGGYPDIGPGLGFRFEKPKGITLPRPYPAAVDNPVGLDGLLQSYAPPYFKDTDAAIDAILAEKYGPNGMYQRRRDRCAQHEARRCRRVRARGAARGAGSRRGRPHDLPVHLEDVRTLSCALPRDRFGRCVDAVPSHRPRVLRPLLHGRVFADAGRPREAMARMTPAPSS